jgi:hypothetical protein
MLLKQEAGRAMYRLRRFLYRKTRRLWVFYGTFGAFITIVNSLDRDKWLSAVRCLY